MTRSAAANCRLSARSGLAGEPSSKAILRAFSARRTASTVRFCSASAWSNRLAVSSPLRAKLAARPPCAIAVCLMMTRQLLICIDEAEAISFPVEGHLPIDFAEVHAHAVTCDDVATNSIIETRQSLQMTLRDRRFTRSVL